MLLPSLAQWLALSAIAGGFSATSSLPQATIGHALLSSNGYLYNVGGLGGVDGVGSAQQVLMAPVQAAGTVGAWRQTTALPEAVYYHSGLAVSGSLYVIGGQHYTDAQGLIVSSVVYVSRLGADGTPGPWQQTATLPEPLFFTAAAMWNGIVYVTGGWNSQTLSSHVHSARINPDGTLSAWTEQRPLPEGVYTHAAVSEGTLYVLGGVDNGGQTIMNTVYAAPINADGSLGAWRTVTPLPQPLSNHAASFANGRILITGGWTGAVPTADAIAAAINPDQSLGAWGSLGALPDALYLHAQAVTKDYLFVSGGTDGNNPQPGVYSLPLPKPFDTTPPVTTLSVGAPKYGAAPMVVTPATLLTLSATDDASGVASTSYAVDSSTYAPYKAPFTVAGDGSHTVSYFSVDNAGNVEPANHAPLGVDGTAPASSLAVGSPKAVLAGGEVIVSPATPLGVSAQDPVVGGVASGVASVSYGVDGAALSAASASFTLSGDGAHSVVTQAVDNLGNAETAHASSVWVDATAPRSTMTVSAGKLLLSASDPVVGGIASGVARIDVSVDGAASSPYTAPVGLGSGRHTASWRSVDNVGNAEAFQTASFIVDLTPPRTTLAGLVPFLSTSTLLSLSATDDLTGVASTQLSIDSAPYAAYAGPFTLSGDGAHWLRYYSVDGSGNVEAVQASSAVVDGTAPFSTLSVGAPQAVLADGLIIVATSTLLAQSAQDPVVNGAASGVAWAGYSIDGGAWKDSLGGPFGLPPVDGAHTVALRAVDRAGNVESGDTRTLYVDGTAPRTTLTVSPSPIAASDGGAPWVGPGAAVSVAAVDPVVNGTASGVGRTDLLMDGAPFTALAEGAHALAFRSVDNVGNAEGWQSLSLRVDLTPPVSTLSVGAPVVSLFGVDIVTPESALTITATDSGSGVARILYAVDGAAEQAYAGAFHLAAGRHSVSFHAVDVAGNVEAAQTATLSVSSFMSDALAASGSVGLSGGSQAVGPVRTNGSLTLAGKAQIQGDAWARSADIDGKASVTGTLHTGQATLVTDALDLSAARATAQAAGPGGAFSLDSRVQQTLPGGRYYFTSLTLAGHASLTFAARAEVFIDGPISVTGGASLQAASGSADDLWLVSTGGTAEFSGHARASLHLYAPSADVSLNGHDQMAGRVLGKTVALAGKASLPSETSLPPVTHRSRGESKREALKASVVKSGAKKDGKDQAVAASDASSKRPAEAGAKGEAQRPVASARPDLTPAVQPAPPAAPVLGGPSRGGAAEALEHAELALSAPPVVRSAPVIPPAVAQTPAPVAAPAPAGTTRKSLLVLPQISPKTAFSLATDAGATVRTSGGSGVVIPEGAVATGLGVSVAPAPAAAPVERQRRDDASSKRQLAVAGPAVQFGPEGTRFAKTVTIELPYDKTAARQGPLVVHYWNPATGDWEPLPSSVDEIAGVVRAQTSHFSLYQVFSTPAPAGSASSSFSLGSVYAYPNPARGKNPTIHVEATGADAIDIKIYDVTGRLVHEGSGADHLWDVSGVGSGVYVYTVTARKQGSGDLHARGRLAVIK